MPPQRLPDHQGMAPEHPASAAALRFRPANGVKVSIMLEEVGLPTSPPVNINAEETFSPPFLSLNSQRQNPGQSSFRTGPMAALALSKARRS